MFSNVTKQLHFISKLKITLTVFVILLIILAFANFFILISLRTTVHKQPDGLLQSVFFIHFHNNASYEDHNERDDDLHKSREIKKADLVNRRRTNGKIENKLRGSKRMPKTLAKTRSSHKTGVVFKKKISEKMGPSTILNSNCTAWCRRGNGLKPPYLLTAVLLVRIYRHDLAKLSSREMIQWLQYLRYAGFQHVYVYDAYVKASESQSDVIEPFVQSGFATYIDWSIHNPYTIQGTQVAAYQDCIDKFGKDSKWQAAIDIDEYPFSPRDLNENFMSRFLDEYTRNNPGVSEITMKNYLFLGKPIDDSIEAFLVGRIRRRTHNAANALVKPIYKPAAIAWAQVHHNGMKTGGSMDSPERMLRMNHYWGARLQNWGDDTPKILDMTEPDYTIEPIIELMKQCASCLGQDGLYVTRWE